MKDLFLIPLLLAVFAFGYYIMRRVDRFVAENRRLIAEENRSGASRLRIAAENPALLDAVSDTLESCSAVGGRSAFFLSTGKKQRLLEKLLEEQVDLVLLNDGEDRPEDAQLVVLPVPCREDDAAGGDRAEQTVIRVVWNKEVRSKGRDRVIFALENGHYSLKRGYADYLEG